MGGAWSACEGYRLPADEICNDFLDNDCDGPSDEQCPCETGTIRPCYSGAARTRAVGVCSDGEQRCVESVWASECTGEVLPTADESCNDLDDDCNGIVDDRLGETSCGLGPCAHTVQNCVDGAPQACDPMAGSTTGTCDGADNDCDGVADEGCSCVNGTTQPCYTGLPGTQGNPPCHTGTQL